MKNQIDTIYDNILAHSIGIAHRRTKRPVKKKIQRPKPYHVTWHKWWTPYGIMAIMSIIAITLCSYSSPLFWTNTSPDSNTYMDAARAMLYGHRVLYSQIFDQKGFYCYLADVLSLLFTRSFFGIYLIEIIGLFLTMYFAYKIGMIVTGYRSEISLFIGCSSMLLALLHPYYDYGDSCESLLFPAVMYLIYKLVQHDNRDSLFSYSKMEWLIQGALVGLIFLTKYTILGSWIAFYIAIFSVDLYHQDRRQIQKMIEYSGIGFVLAVLPYLIYAVATRSLGAFFRIYFYDNIVLYAKTDGVSSSLFAKLIASFTNVSELFVNSTAVLLVLFVLAFAAVIKKGVFLKHRRAKYLYLVIAFADGLLELFSYTIGNAYQYYELILLPFMLPALILAIRFIFSRYVEITKHNHIAAAIITCLCLMFLLLGVDNNVSSSRLFPNNPSVTLNQLDRKKEEPFQTEFGHYIDRRCDPKKSSLLEYGSISLGVYNTSGITPDNYYFQNYNFSEKAFPNAIRAQRRNIENGDPQWVVLTTPINSNIQHWAGTPDNEAEKILPGNLNTGTAGKFNEYLFKNYAIKLTHTFSFEAQNQRAYLLERRPKPLSEAQLQSYLYKNSFKYMRSSKNEQLTEQIIRENN